MLSLAKQRCLQHGIRTLTTKTLQRAKIPRVQNRTIYKLLQTRGTPSPTQTSLGLSQAKFMSSQTRPAIVEKDSLLTLELCSERFELPYLWLRDHCRCNTCYNHSTNQKNILSQDLDHDIRPSQVTLADDLLTLTWPDGHVTSYTLSWLRINSYPGPKEEKVRVTYYGLPWLVFYQKNQFHALFACF